MRDDDRELDDRDELGRSWRPEDRGERDERGRLRFERRFDQRFDPRLDRQLDDPPRDRDDRGWNRRDERFSESERGREPYGVRDRDDRGERDRGERDRGERDRGELRVDIRGYRDPTEGMPRQDQLLRGAYRDHDESSRDLSYRGQTYGAPAGATSSSPREPMPQRHGPHAGKGPVGFQRSDERIRELVCEALTDDGEVDASRIEVSVQAGEVTLTGAIEDRRMKRLAEDCVEAVPGVKDVHNQLRIGQLRIGEPPAAAERGAQSDRTADRHEPPDKKHRPS